MSSNPHNINETIIFKYYTHPLMRERDKEWNTEKLLEIRLKCLICLALCFYASVELREQEMAIWS